MPYVVPKLIHSLLRELQFAPADIQYNSMNQVSYLNKKRVCMTSRCYNHRSETNPWRHIPYTLKEEHTLILAASSIFLNEIIAKLESK